MTIQQQVETATEPSEKSYYQNSSKTLNLGIAKDPVQGETMNENTSNDLTLIVAQAIEEIKEAQRQHQWSHQEPPTAQISIVQKINAHLLNLPTSQRI